MDPQRLVDLRRIAESRWTFYFLAVWSFLSFVGGVFQVIRGHQIGWAWMGVGVAYAFGAATNRWAKRRLLAALGDRGRVARTARYQLRAERAYRFAAVWVAAYITMKVFGYAYPDSMPSWAETMTMLLAAVAIVGALGYVAVRMQMYLAHDDRPSTDR